MNKLLLTLRMALILGGRRQSFLGARWVPFLVRHSPAPWKRAIALRLLALSPHYFYRQARPEYKAMKTRQFLEAECERNRASRRLICERILGPYLDSTAIALDVGCGPGWLARYVCERAKRVYACDISEGVLECAKVLNPAENLVYFLTGDGTFPAVPDDSVDLAYSFAVIQHVTDEVFGGILDGVYQKLKGGGRCVFHVVLSDAKGWRSESEWRSDSGIYGKIKWHYGLNGFYREQESVMATVLARHFVNPRVVKVRDLIQSHFDDIADQHLLVFEKPR